MRIVTWNANCRFREKWRAIAELGADVYVIQECENPLTCKGVSDAFRAFAERGLWWGERDFKGLGVFAAPGVSLAENQWEVGGHRVFGCVRVNGVLDLLAVWTKPMGSGSYAAYVRQFLSYHALNAHRFSPEMVVMGDFNSNTQWDGRRWKDTHRDIVQALAQNGLVSAYHYVSGEEPGQESEPSFCRHAGQTKPTILTTPLPRPLAFVPAGSTTRAIGSRSPTTARLCWNWNDVAGGVLV